MPHWLVIAVVIVIGMLALSVLLKVLKAALGIAVLVLVIWLCYHFLHVYIHGSTLASLLQELKVGAGRLKTEIKSTENMIPYQKSN